MGQQWHYTRGGAQAGPVDIEVLQQMVAAGQVGPDELVWTDGMPEWQRAGNIPLFFAAPPITVSGDPQVQVGTPVASQHGVASLNYYAPQTGVVYAGFWLRFCALVVDSVILFLVQAPIDWALGAPFWEDQATPKSNAISQLTSILIWWLYAALQESSVHQATLGKRAVGIMVTDTRGRRISLARATGRHFAQYLSALIIGIGFLMAAFTKKKQALHDQMADTLVIKKRPE